jgi:hypothetical protein
VVQQNLQDKVGYFFSGVFGACDTAITQLASKLQSQIVVDEEPVNLVDEIKEGEEDTTIGEPPEFANENNCKYCNVKFSILGTSRHHCRRCGSSVCDTCSPNKGLLQINDEDAAPEKVRVCIDCEDPPEPPADREGWLMKEGQANKKWQRRFFILTRGKLTYFESQGKGLKGTVDLKYYRVTSTELIKDAASGGYNFILANIDPWGRSYALSATSLDERAIWVENFSRQIDFYNKTSRAPSPGLHQTVGVPYFPPPKEGWMVKEGHLRRTWKKRFFSLSNGRLTYSESQGKGLKGNVDLINYLVAAASDKDSSDSGVFLLYLTDVRPAGKSYRVGASSAEERSDWVAKLQNHIDFYANGLVLTTTPSGSTSPASTSPTGQNKVVDLERYQPFLHSGEIIVQCGKVIKKGLGVLPIGQPDHMLILTNVKRLFFVDLESFKLKGTLDLNAPETKCSKVSLKKVSDFPLHYHELKSTFMVSILYRSTINHFRSQSRSVLLFSWT